MNRATLLALAERVEAATGADNGIDSEIHHAVLNGVGVGSYGAQPTYTASLDAAMSLVPSGIWTGEKWNVECWDTSGVHAPHVRATAWVNGSQRVYAATPALALTAACLRALAIAGSMTDD